MLLLRNDFLKQDSLILRLRLLLTVIFLFIIFYFNYHLPRTNFTSLVLLYGAGFAIYATLLQKPFLKQANHFKWIIGLGILSRFLILFSFPNLSDDYFRFIWDGLLSNNGFNPYDFRPDTLMSEISIQNKATFQMAFANMNSPNYFSVYPPINQYIFTFSTYLFPTNFKGAVIIMKLFMFCFELLSIFSIYKIAQNLSWNKNAVLWYALNPLIIIEFCGNLHFEGAMLAFLLFAIYLLTIKKYVLSAVIFSGAVLTKLHPLMLLPFIIKYLGWKKGIAYSIIVGIISVIIAAPLLIPLDQSLIRLDNVFTSLQLYFQTFEYNASIYYIARWIGFQIYDYNAIQIIGKLLMAINIIALGTLFLFQKKNLKGLLLSIALAYFIYNLLATTVHPWYILSILPFALLINFKTPLFWSGIVILSYFAYSTPTWHENFYFLFIEYTFIFAVLIYELNKKLLKADSK